MNNMKKAREHAGLSQKEVAITLNVSAPTVSEWESEKKNPNANNLKSLSKLYKVSTDYLLGQTDDSMYIERNSSKIYTNNPISFLVNLYHVKTPVLASITGVSYNKVDEWIDQGIEPNEEEYAALSDFFEIDVQSLQKGVLPLFPDESVQIKVKEATDMRFAAYGKNDEFTPEEIQSIADFMKKIKQQRRNQ